MKNRVGLLGGTFNPIHRGHIELGMQILNAFLLEKVLFILSAQPPHKKNSKIASVEIRWEMLNKALKPFPELVPCDIEIKRSAWSWTVETVKELKKEYPGTKFFFISGSEGFLRIRTWKNYEVLLKSLSFIVVLREPGHREAIEMLLKEEKITFHPSSPSVHIFSYESDKLLISSTLIREKVKLSQQIDDFVDNEVIKIMEENKLYGSW